jgi:hypothetical protein
LPVKICSLDTDTIGGMDWIQLGSKDMKKTKFVIITLCCLMFCWVSAAAGNDLGPCVVVYFDSGKALLNDQKKAELRSLFQKYDVNSAGRVFVVGFTDSRGAKSYNYSLSRKRAEGVRSEIIKAFGVDATVVMAMGKGPENPVADNGKVDGRVQNRRVEIYLANAVEKAPERAYGSQDPYWPSIEDLVKEADALVRQRRTQQALQKLEQAYAIGGDHYSDWHTVMGIAGFYSGASQARAHLVTAVQLDPYNFTAREFLSRLQARRNVAYGKVTSKMGQSPQDAIAITAPGEAHEYLQLFGVEPLVHRELKSKPVDVWECVDQGGRQVAYYFNRAPVFEWVFAKRSEETVQIGRQRKAILPAGGGHIPAPEHIVAPVEQPTGTEKRSQIWESELFK